MQNLLRFEEALFGYVGPLGAIKIRGLPGSLRYKEKKINHLKATLIFFFFQVQQQEFFGFFSPIYRF